MIIAGLSGGIGHGKTTFAQDLAGFATKAKHWEASDIVAEVASSLRQASSSHPDVDDIEAINRWLAPLTDILTEAMHSHAEPADFELTAERLQQNPQNYIKLFEYLNLMQKQPELQSGPVNDANKKPLRPLLQWLGGYLVKQLSAGIWFDEITRRLQAEKLDLATVGGVRFPGDAERLRQAGGVIIAIKRPDLTEVDTADLTERERSLIKADSLVYNNGSLADLQACARTVYEDLQKQRLKTTYEANQARN